MQQTFELLEDVTMHFTAFAFVTIFLYSATHQVFLYPQHWCGLRKPFSRVIGGSNALDDSWPWQAEILQMPDKRHKCGGTLIHDQWVVTAAHCVFMDPDPKQYKVVLGQYDRTVQDPGEREYDVISVRIHEKYMTKIYDYSFDIALLKLAHPAFPAFGMVRIACLPLQGERVPVGKDCYITGWGKTSSPERSSFANVLQEAKLPIVDYATCAAGNVNLTYAKVDDETMVCAGYGGDSVVSGCHGDSGGPLICEEGGHWVLRGAVSWGDHFCRGGKTFSVFARISRFVDWIHKTMKRPDHNSFWCEDYLAFAAYCANWSKNGMCNNRWYKNYLKKYCPKSCGYDCNHTG